MTTKVTPNMMDLPFLMPEQYGAAGDLVADESTEVGNMIAASITDKKPVEILGRYKLDSAITQSMTVGDHFVARGNGPSSSTLLINNTTGGLFFPDGENKQFTVTLERMHFKPGLADSGQPLSVTRTAGGLDKDSSVLLRDIHIGPENENDEDEDFSNGLDIDGSFRARLDNVKVISSSATAKWDYMLNVDNSYKPELSNVFLNCVDAQPFGGGALVGISDVGTDQEGFNWQECTVNGADIGLNFIRDSREPGFRMTKGHFNNEVKNVYIEGMKDGIMEGMLMYGPSTYAGEFIDFHIVDGEKLNFVDVEFRQGNVGGSRRHFYLEPKVGGVVRDIYIHSNLMSAETDVAPFYIGAGCTNITIHLPNYIPTVDNANYPNQLVEIDASVSPDEVTIITASGPLSYQDGSSGGPDWKLMRVSASPASGDALGSLKYVGQNDAAEEVDYGVIRAKIETETDGSEDGSLEFFTQRAGTSTRFLDLNFPAVNNSSVLEVGVRESGALVVYRVKVGAADSGGTGQRLLTIDN